MKNEVFEYQIIILTGQRLYDQFSRDPQKPAKFILADNPRALLLLLREAVGVTLLLDLNLFDDDVEHPMVKAILKKGFQQRIMVMTDEQDPAKLYRLMEQGVRGICPSMLNDDLLMRAIQSVNEGELWIGRQFVSYLIGKLILERSNKGTGAASAVVKGNRLTAREAQIATHVAQGKCDKLIARDLNISPNTVKNHLQNIFKKLQITDRFQLALIFHGVINH